MLGMCAMESLKRWTFRNAQESDAEAVYQIHVESIRTLCSVHYNQQTIDNWTGRLKVKDYIQLMQREDDFVLIEDNEQTSHKVVIGFGQVGRYVHTTDDQRFSPSVNFEIKKFYISPRVKRQGAGRALFEELQRRAIKQGCTHLAVESTLTAVPFYESCGLVVTKEQWIHSFKGDLEFEDTDMDAKVLEKRIHQSQIKT